MKNSLFLLIVLLVPVVANAQDMEGSKDHVLFGRLEGYTITDYYTEDSGEHLFKTGLNVTTKVEGVLTYIYYESGGKILPAKVLESHANIIKSSGGRVVYEFGGNASTLTLKKGGKEYWIDVYAGETCYCLTIVEK